MSTGKGLIYFWHQIVIDFKKEEKCKNIQGSSNFVPISVSNDQKSSAFYAHSLRENFLDFLKST